MVKRETKITAQALRKNQSLPERLIWGRIKTRTDGHPIWRRQHPIGPYIIDFLAKAKLVVEIDGYAQNMGDRPRKDEIRDAYLSGLGYRIERINAGDVIHDPDDICDGLLILAMELVLK